MMTIVICINDGNLEINSYEIKNNIIRKHKTEDIVDIVNYIKLLEQENFSSLKINENDVNFNVDDVNIIIKDYENLKKNPLFEVLNVKINRSYRQQRLKQKHAIRIASILVASAITLGGIALVKATLNAKEKESYDNDTMLSEITEDEDVEEIVEIDNKSFDFSNTTNNYDESNNENYNYSCYNVNIPYDDRSDSITHINCINSYGSLISKYSKMYGLDENLMIALATQEGGGVHKSEMTGSAIGLMQIEYNVWHNQTIKVFNFETGEYESLEITDEVLKDVSSNIKLGCMIMRQQLDYMDNNLIAALYSYNMGYGNMQKILGSYANEKGCSINDVLSDFSDAKFVENHHAREINVGDKNYVTHVLSYMGNNPSITILTKDGEAITTNVSNSKTNVRS